MSSHAHSNNGSPTNRAGQRPDVATAVKISLNPSFEHAHGAIASDLILLKGLDEALNEAMLESDLRLRYGLLPCIYAKLGRRQEADAAMAREEREFAHVDASGIAESHACRGEVDQALSWLERAFQRHEPGAVDSKVDPMLINLRNEPRFKKLLSDYKLSDGL